MSELNPFENRLAALIAALSPAGRRNLSAEIAKTLRQQQQQRIKAQRAPDGTPYEERRPQTIKGKKGRVKREMFAKLRTSRYMKARGDESAAAVEFTGKVQRIARVHQYGLRDKPGQNSQAVLYPVRPLLGFSESDRQIIETAIIHHLAG
ncbi:MULTISPECIES: phage virion morphogenesis protein [Enterobacteriaceae]|uniref:phage virion morphogenesis protein n=1 Tax=Enterobacteriaceae TaxID=543 RepID=UPI002576D747|nr:phage virion morphogenesis protein [Citrobacter sp. Cf084]EKS1206220.1 phage virion morphogenesis protein [Escherichia coli]EKT9260830.1 phage virion morphogenesis protein [Citrobacter freundii]EKW0767141.1 phage virion morphogenesis protein [Citrobacter freundii]MDM3218693.1 phage virion morphogenesis protein [Citrobacter sp. Cf084]HCL6566321.1 phage virion morphogenesis protein [Citrobacter freundii]